MALSQLALLQAVNGVVWTLLGLLNVIALITADGAPLFGWWQASGIAVAVTVALGVLTIRAIQGALARAEPAVGVFFAAPSQTIGRCIGPAAIAVAILVALALIPGGEGYRGLAALMFLAIGGSYLPIAAWVRRFEEMNGVIVGQPVNRAGMRTGAIRVLRLPR
ncbi:MAG: hypothetical protein ACR2JV_01695 [Gaiellales bacterium]